MHRQWAMFGLILLGVTSALWVTSSSHREPTYGGKTVTQWLDAGYEDCATALHEIGPAALPFILTNFRRAEKSPSIFLGWKLPFEGWRRRFQKIPACNLDENRICSLTLELGPRTIPMLAQELDSPHANVRAASARALSMWRDQGKNIQVAVPGLTRALQDPNASVRTWAVYALRADDHLVYDRGNARNSAQ